MSKARNLSDFISDPTISSTEIADQAVTHAKLHTTMDLSSKTVTLPTLSSLDVGGNITTSGTVDGIDIAARDGVLTSTTTTAGAALPKAGGSMTGELIIADTGTLDIRMGTDKRVTWSGALSEIGSVAGFQATNTAGSALSSFGMRGTDLRFATGSEERVRITDTGVGIGISPTHLLHVQAGSTGNGDVKIGGGAGLLISHNNSGATVQTIKSLYHATSASSNLRIVTGFLTVSTGTSDTERLRLKSNGSFEIGYAGAGLQQADNQAMTITTPASGGGQGIAIKRLDSNSDQQIGEITFSNNTQDGQAGIRVKTQGAVNTTDMHFDVNNAGGAVTSALKIDGSQGGKISIVSREMSIQNMELRHGTFGVGNYNRRVELQLGNYESCHVRIMAQRTNGGSCLVYWEGYINNNNNAAYLTTIAERTSDGTISFSRSISGGNTSYFRWDFNASGSGGDGSFAIQGARGGPSINITTW